MFDDPVIIAFWAINAKKKFRSLHLDSLSKIQAGSLVFKHLVTLLPIKPYGKREDDVPWGPAHRMCSIEFCI